MIEKTTRLNLLYDFYKNLLTEKQQNIFEMYFQDDLSFSEIADELDISRQAVNDTLRRTESSLEEYEEKLALVNKYERKRRLIVAWRERLSSSMAGNQDVIEKMIQDFEELD